MAAVADWFRPKGRHHAITETARTPIVAQAPASKVQREGFVYGVPPQGLDDVQTGIGAATGTDRKTLLQELYEAYLSCPWAWASVQAIARTITAGGLVTDWVGDDGEGDQDAPDKPPEVLALEALLAFCNPTQNIRQVIRNFIADLLVFGDAYLELVWWGSRIVAIYNQDSPTTTPVADAHGAITRYVQVSDFGQRAEFEPHEIIHVSLDAARPGVTGISPMQAALGPVTAWLHAFATGKEAFKKGLPPNVHVDHPAGMPDGEMRRWRDQYFTRNTGAKNLGAPVQTKGGGKVTELQTGKISDVKTGKDQARDEILACVIPGTKIFTSTGLVPVEEMRAGMLVLTHTGRWKPVTEVLANPTYAPVLEIKANGFDALSATSNHPVWAGGYKQDRGHGHQFTGYSWVSAGEIRPRVRNKRGISHALTLPGIDFAGGSHILRCADFLSLGPRNTALGFEAQRAWDDGEHIRHTSTRVRPIPSEIKMGRAFGRLLGLYLAEGHTINGSGTCWSFHEDETHLQEEVRDALGEVFGLTNVSVKKVKKSKCVNVYVRNVFLAELLSCGKALTKRLPEWAWQGDSEFLEGVLSGWADGDGTVQPNGAGGSLRQRVTTKSETLAWQMRVIAITLGIPATMQSVDCPNQDGRELNGYALRSNGPAYVLSWSLDPKRAGTYRIEECTLTSPVRSAEPTGYDGVVYNLEVADDNSYVTTSGTVHNCFGVPPAQAGVIESGNLGGGTGESQWRSFQVITCQPIAELVLEALNFAVVQQAFKITEWLLKFGEVDWRDSTVIEQIRDTRLRNGGWTLNKYRADIGEPPVEGGDDAVLVDRQNLVLWKDMADMSHAQVAGKGAPAVAAGEQPPNGEPLDPDDEEPGDDNQGQPPGGKPPRKGPAAESLRDRQYAAYQARLRQALAALPITESDKTTGDDVHDQLADGFPPDLLGWVKDAEWSGPKRVAASRIDLRDRDQWAASHDGRVPKVRAKLAKRQKDGKQLKPAVLVQPPDGKMIVVDGHHRVAAYLDEDQAPWAYVGRVKQADGPWMFLHASQLHGNR